MNWPYLHLVINHFPIILAIVGAAAAAAGQALRRQGVARYGAVCLVLAALAAPFAYLTGLRAEEGVEEVWYASGAAIEEHGELALWALVAALTSGATAAVWLRRGGRRLGSAMAALGVAGALALGIAALQGGRIVHGDAPPPPAAGPAEGDAPVEADGG